MYISDAKAILPAVAFLHAVANSLNDELLAVEKALDQARSDKRDLLRANQSISDERNALNDKLTGVTQQLAELEARNAVQYDKINEQEKMYHTLSSDYSRLSECNDNQSNTIMELKHERDKLSQQLTTYSGCSNQILQLEKELEHCKGYAAYVYAANTTNAQAISFEEWSKL